MGCGMLIAYYLMYSTIGICAISAYVFNGHSTEEMDGVGGIGLVLSILIMATIVSPILSILTEIIVSRRMERNSAPIPLNINEVIADKEGKFNTFPERAAAFTIDHLIISLACFILDYIFPLHDYFMAVYFSAFTLYATMSVYHFNKTIGKKIMHLEIANATNDARLKFHQSLIRNSSFLALAIISIALIFQGETLINYFVMFSFCTLMAYVLADFVFLLASKNQTTVHDKISKTFCVRI